MAEQKSGSRVGVYVDAANIAMNGGFGMRFDVLREFSCRGGATPVRLNAYVGYDAERAARDDAYREGQEGFFSTLRDFGYKVIQKNVKWYYDENGNSYGKANADLDMAVDMLLQSENFDRIVLVTGDGDFVQVVRALQNRGSRVEVLAFDNVSADLRREADMFMSGYLIPNLLPTATARGGSMWGELGSRVRGTCYNYLYDKGYGFLRFMKGIEGDLWRVDSRQDNSPFGSAFFYGMPAGVSPKDLPSRNFIFEFEIAQGKARDWQIQASNIQLISPRRERTPKPESPVEEVAPT